MTLDVAPPATTAFGIDIGGTGIKGGIVDLATGTLASDRFRLDTPKPATPEAVGETVEKVAAHFPEYSGPFGIAFPGVVTHGVVHTAANVDPSWIGVSLVDAVSGHVPGPVIALNDADAAGLAEARYGAGKGHPGLVVVITFGTGIGTALLYDGQLVPNAELGHLELDGFDAETRAAASARERDGLNWTEWSARANRYLSHLEALLWPELFIFGCGISKSPHKWVPHLSIRTPFKIASMANNAGIVGAALAGAEGRLA
jgi:polyphosphate glucokinase